MPWRDFLRLLGFFDAVPLVDDRRSWLLHLNQ
jgi:hypothetical protein